MDKIIKISSNGIKQAIDDLVNENEMLQDKIYKLESIIKEAIEYIENRKENNKSCSVCSVITDELLEILKGEQCIK